MEELQKRILDLEIKLLKIEENKLNSSRSFELNELFSALAKAQGEMESASQSNINHWKKKYSTIADILEAATPALSKNGLAIIQQLLSNPEGKLFLHTILTHNSGQWIESRIMMRPIKDDAQEIGKYITYMRRYALASLISVVCDEEDDDGDSDKKFRQENKENQKKIVEQKLQIQHQEETIIRNFIVPEQLHELEYELTGHPDIAQNIKDKLKINTLADMKQENFINVINHIRKTKQAKEKAIT